MEPNDGFYRSLVCDYQENLLTRAKEDELFIDRVTTEGKVYPGDQGFLTDYHDVLLTKRRRIDCEYWLFMNGVIEDGLYNDHAISRSLCIDTQKDSLDEVRRLADDHRLLTVGRAGFENRVDKNLNPVLSTEYPVDPLDVRIADDERFVHKNRLFSDFDLDSGFGQAFASARNGNPLNRSRLSIYDDRFLIDDCVQREYNASDIVKPVVYGDGNLDLLAEARKMTHDHQCSTNVNLENRYHVDCDGSSASASENLCSLLHKIRKTTAGGRFPITERVESEPNFVTCSPAGFSSENFANPLRYGLRTFHDGMIPIVEGKVTENVADSILCSAASKNSGYIASVGGRVADDDRSRKSGGVENVKGIHKYASSVISTEYPSSSKTKRNLFSFCDKCLPETRLSQSTEPQNSDPSHSTSDYGTITKAFPYVPELPNIAHGCSSSLAADRNSSLERENLPHHGSLGTYYSLSKNSTSPYCLKSKNSSRCLGIAPECGSKGLATNSLSHQSSLFHETTNSFLNSKSSMHADLDTYAPVGYRGSLFSKYSISSVRSPVHENIERGKRWFRYPFKSSEHHSALDGNLPIASLHMREYVPRRKMDMLAGKDFPHSEANDFSVGVHHPERDLKSNDDQYFKNLKKHQEISETPHSDSNIRRSVFTRLTSGQVVQVDEDRFNCHDCYMDASADEVMKMLHKGNNLPPRKLRKIRIVGQPNHGEAALDEKQIQSCNEINHSTMEKKKPNDAYLAVTEGYNEVLKETRTVDFKRRSETKKSLVETRAVSVANGKITTVSGEVGSSAKMILKRKRLVRPVFRKNELVTDGSVSINQNILVSGQILDKDDKQSCKRAINMGETKISNDGNDALALSCHQSMDCNIKENSSYEDQKDLGPPVLLSTHHEIKGHKASNVDLQAGSSQVLLKETSQHKFFGIQTSTIGVFSRDVDTTVCGLNLPETSSDGVTLDASCGIPREEKKSRLLKSRKKIIRTCKTGMECSQ